MTIEVFEIEFRETENLILTKEQYTDLFDISKKYAFNFGDVKKVKRKTINITDFPKKEWSC